MKVSVLIPTFNRQHLLARTLSSLFAQQFAGDEFEVVVVVDGSSDGTAAWLRSLQAPCLLRIVEQPHGGRIAARNAGFQAAQGELLLLLDDDILCPANLLRQHVAAHAGCDRLVAFGANCVADESPPTIFTAWARETFAEWRRQLQRDPTPQWPQHLALDANYSLPRALIQEFGGYDERFHTREIELGLRLWKAGVRFQYLPGATAYHIYDKHDSMVRADALPYGREEVLLCRAQPEYRSFSAFSSMEQSPGLRWLVRSWLARVPFDPDRLLRPLFRLASAISGAPKMKRAALRLLNLRHSTTMLRGAVQEAGSWQAYREQFARRLPVLLYHHVGPRLPGTHPGLTVSPADFERQLRGLLCWGYTPITIEQWSRWIKQGGWLPSRPVLITFDDGYADLADYAFPVLQKHGCSALVFVVTRLLGSTNVWDEKAGWGTHRLMTAEQVRYWAQRGMEFGAHGSTHLDLSQLDEPAAEREVCESQHELAAILGRKPQAFAYPYGEVNGHVARAVAGHFDCAFTTQSGWNTLATDRFHLRRFVVDPGDRWLGLATRLWLPRLQHWRDCLALRTRLRSVAGGANLQPVAGSHHAN